VRNPQGDPEILPTRVYEQFDKIWDGPLVVMVNKNSASASEIFSAAIQDYNRGIIIGGNTYGKGTVQRFIDLNEMVQPKPEKSIGSIKITMQKFYRVNGNTTQFKGVVPDIALPDALGLMPYGEKDADYPLPYDKIAPCKFNPYQAGWDKTGISKKAKEQVEGNNAFTLLEKQAKQIRADYDHSLKSLQLSKYAEERKAQVENKKDFDNMVSADTTKIVVNNLTVDMDRFRADSSAAARNNDFKKRLRKDIYLYQSVRVAEAMKK
jgi:carboxyl-terminal processing protease